MRTIILSALFWPVVAFSQILLDFESDSLDGWKQFPPGRWDTSSSLALNGGSSLKHVFNNTEAGADRISYPLKGLTVDSGNTAWQFTVKHAYNPSSSNNWTFFLLSGGDASDMLPSGNINGYAVGVNYNSSDDILKLFKITEGNASALISSGLNWEQTFGTEKTAVIRVTRSPYGEWMLSAGLHPDSMKTFGPAVDGEFTQSFFMGILYRYTASADMKLWLDDISVNGVFIADTAEPMITDISVISSRELLLTFSEPVSPVSRCNFFISDTLHQPDSVKMQSDKTIYLRFPDAFPGKQHQQLSARSISDLSGNVLVIQSYDFIYYHALAHDIVINEIMADPDPPVGLPPFEYIELHNTSDYPVQLGGWKLAIGSGIRQLPVNIMPTGSYLILSTSSGCSKLKEYGKCLPVFSSSSTLSNEGNCLVLSDKDNFIISSVCYDNSLYTETLKNDGGWSLEQIDPSRACAAEGNWAVSTGLSGGTPGKRNSVYADNPDNSSPYITEIGVLSDSSLLVSFSENIDTAMLNNPKAFYVEPEIGYPSKTISKNHKDDTLFFSNHFAQNTIYSLLLKKAFGDCSGNLIDNSRSYSFALPVTAMQEDLIINEILFDPKPGCPEFVELFNKSDKVIDIGKILIASKDAEKGTMMSSSRIAGAGAYAFPEEYLVITTDSNALKTFYNCGGRLLETKEMPSLKNDESVISILNADGSLVDELHYKDDLHFSVLNNTEGISLERVRVNEPAQNKDNWRSASSSSGYATPGIVNSQYLDDSIHGNEISIYPEVFSPDNDGKDDYLTISYKFDNPGNMATIIIFDAVGRSVKRITTNALLGINGFFTWDGLDENKNQPPTGIYLVYAEITVPSAGKILKYKKTCVMGGRY